MTDTDERSGGVPFTKMHGLGNDFVVVAESVEVTPDLVRRVCDRRFGVGADGLLRVSKPADRVVMEYWNADGSTSEMCGNGLRCVARIAVEWALVPGPEFIVETPAGGRTVRVDGSVVTAELGPAEVGEAVDVDGRRYVQVSVGNPHAVTWVDDPAAVDVAAAGSALQHHPAFPEGVNVEFLRRVGADAIEMRVWERGVGETLACGSGMVAAAAVARGGDGAGEISVHVRGGNAAVRFDERSAWLTGPAEIVFEGRLAFSAPS